MRAMQLLCLLLLVITGANNPAIAQDNGSSLILAGVEGNALRLYTYDSEDAVLTDSRTLAQAGDFDSLAWSPNGFILSAIQTISPMVEFAPTREELVFVPVPLEPDYADPFVVITDLSQDLETSFRANFTDEGWLTFVIRPQEDRLGYAGEVEGVIVDVYQVYYLPGASLYSRPQKIGEIVRQYGCGRVDSTPMEARLRVETEVGLVLVEQTPYGIVFAPGCFGHGVALADGEKGEYALLHQSMWSPRVSPDGERVAGVGDSRLEVVTLSNGNIQTYPVEASAVTQLEWSADGNSLFYAVQSEGGRMAVTDDELSVLQTISSFSESLLATYTVELFQLDLTSGKSSLLYASDDAYAIGRMQVTPDGEALVFSQVANGGEAWLQYMLSTGSVFRYNEIVADISLHYLPLDGGAPQFIGDGIAQMALYPGDGS